MIRFVVMLVYALFLSSPFMMNSCLTIVVMNVIAQRSLLWNGIMVAIARHARYFGQS